MWYWLFIIISGIITLACAYLVFMAVQASDSQGAYIFAAFGFLFGLPFIIALLRFLGQKSRVFRYINDMLVGRPEPARVTFVPHWFMMTAITVTVIVILAAILLPLLLR